MTTAKATSAKARHRLATKRGSATRRRGDTLEAALLDAAWDEFTAVGYASLTIKGVAARAKTSRAVLYRRWPNRPELVMAAIRHRTKLAPLDIPDTGSLRGDVLAVLRHVSESWAEITGVLSFLIADYFDETGLPPSVLHQREFVGSTTMEVIFERAVQRGEIDPGRLSPRIASLPLDLVRHDMIMNRASVPDATLIEIVDHLFLPLVRQPQVARPRLPKRKERP